MRRRRRKGLRETLFQRDFATSPERRPPPETEKRNTWSFLSCRENHPRKTRMDRVFCPYGELHPLEIATFHGAQFFHPTPYE